MQLPLKLSWDLAQTQWKSQLDPVLANLLLQGNFIQGIMLFANAPRSINTSLQRTQKGFFICDQNASAIIFRTQPFNYNILTLESSADVTISLWVF